MSTTSSRAGRRIRVPSSTMCRRPHQGSRARSGRSPRSAASRGGSPAALGGGDISHDGRRIALFRFEDKRIALVVVTRDGSGGPGEAVPPNSPYDYPRWSPDDRWIAFNKTISTGFNERRLRRPCSPGGDAHEIARSADLSGLSWLPDRLGRRLQLLLREHRCSTHPCSTCERSSATGRAIASSRSVTCPTGSPTCTCPASLTASRIRMQSDIWKFPVNGSPAENTQPRPSHHTSDRSGADPVGESG